MKASNPLIGYLLCVVMFILGVIAMNGNMASMLGDREKDIAAGRTLILDDGLRADSLYNFFMDAAYMTDPLDATLASGWITEKLKTDGIPENLGELNRPAYKIPARQAMAEGGKGFRKRVLEDYQRLGMDGEWVKAKKMPLTSDFGNGQSVISVRIINAPSVANAPLEGLLVRLREHSLDTVKPAPSDRQKAPETILDSRTLGFAVTDASGEARFHVDPGKSYSVIPVNEGFQYGREKGTTATGSLDKSGLGLTFRQQEHKITPLDSYTYQAIKADGSMIVRTPQQFLGNLVSASAIYLIGWLAFFIFMGVRDRKLNSRSDYLLATLIMALTGICILSMFGMTNPLSDKCYGLAMAHALLWGLLAMGLISCVNPAKFFAGKSLLQAGAIPFDPLDRIFSPIRKKHSLERTSSISFSTGFSYLIAAVGLIFLLSLFGTGPEGSDAKVNLGGFQPSEISKYLILIFVAAFFAENGLLLQAFSSRLTTLSARRQLGTVALVIGAILFLMLLYLFVLSDMGPALVVLVTFIFLYSMIRRDFAQLLLGLLSFIAFMLVVKSFSDNSLVLLAAAAVWFIAWIAFWWFHAHKIHESAIIVNLLIVIFSLGAPILAFFGAESEAARLTNRTEMSWGGQWDNHVLGGDQVAQSIWSVASGGVSGMGLGNGSPSVVPAFHTDMAFTSVGEMLGLAGLILITVCFVLLVHRTLLIGRRAGQPFTMYLTMGIGILTGIQFLLIVFGSLGIVPLTGVTVPFISYSRTSLIATMGAFGIVLAASRLRSTESQRQYASSFTGAIAANVIFFILGAFVITGTLINYQIINKDETLIRPAYITNTMGAREIEYNPRIKMVLNRLHAGNIYDTNGLLLATSSPDSLISAIPSVTPLGINATDLRHETHRRKSRYYTMGAHLLFLLGDAGTAKVLGYRDSDPIGFMAEARYAGELRGIDIPTRAIALQSEKFRENRFMPPSGKTWKLREKDYRNLLPFMKDGLDNNPVIDSFNAERHNRDMYLTVDARLQKKLQDGFSRYLPVNFPQLDRLRASVVVLNASTGDLLSSANYPLPEQDSIVMMNERKFYGGLEYEKIPNHRPWTQRDLGMTFATPPGSTAKVMTAMAALKSLGLPATEITYNIRPQDGIEPPGIEPTGVISFKDAIVRSSNNYFINILHDKNIYSQLGEIYETVGARLHNRNGDNASSYYFNLGELNNSNEFNAILSSIASNGMKNYGILTGQGNIPRWLKWSDYDLALAWGQSALLATPLTMARVASIVANDGKLAPTRYIRRTGHNNLPLAEPISVLGPDEAKELRQYMQLESQKLSTLPNHPGDPKTIGGKTGTPERGGIYGKPKSNDAWYICFMFSKKLNAPVAVALRLERTGTLQSDKAKKAMAELVIPILNSAGYMIY